MKLRVVFATCAAFVSGSARRHGADSVELTAAILAELGQDHDDDRLSAASSTGTRRDQARQPGIDAAKVRPHEHLAELERRGGNVGHVGVLDDGQ